MSDFPLQAMIDYALATRGEDSVQRDLAKGLDKNQEEYAFKHVCPRVERRDETRALRIVGLLADSGVPHDSELPFGQWCASLDAGQVETRLLTLQNLPFEQAIKEIRRLLNLAGGNPRGFNWYGLAETLYFWGDKTTEGSRKTRLRILSDFYRNSVKEQGTEKKGKGDEADRPESQDKAELQ